MLHIVFDRPNAVLVAYDSFGSVYGGWPAAGDAWAGHGPGYGLDGVMPPGHFKLEPVQFFNPPIASEGFGQIPVEDLDVDSLAALVKAGRAVVTGVNADIGGITLKIGQLAAYGRSDIMIHGGGSNSPDPLADNQGFYKTDGCTRMLNKDWKTLATWLAPQFAGNIVVYSAIGDPSTLED